MRDILEIEDGVLLKYIGPRIHNEPIDVIIPHGVYCISHKAFRGVGIRSIYIPSTVTILENGICEECYDLEYITIPPSVKKLGRDLFLGCDRLRCIILGCKPEKIDTNTFRGCRSLTSITLPDSITDIGHCAFGGCEDLVSIHLPAKLEHIGSTAFCCCESLKTITLPDGVRSIDAQAFEDCHQLTAVTIPASVNHIGQQAFSGCECLTIYAIPDSYAHQYAVKHNIPFTPLEN